MAKLSKFAWYAWVVLGYNLLVILWGAYVRATGSGAGCGSHWPLCNGQVIPTSPQIQTVIEFVHRMTSGLSILLITILVIWAYLKYPRKSPVRLGASLSMIFILTEAIIGAGLVLLGYVAHNVSLNRAVSIGLHLINTFLLLAVLTLTAWWASTGIPVSLRRGGVWRWVFLTGFLGVMLIGVSGALTALGDTLFPVDTFFKGMKQDFLPTANFLIRLRVMHPLISILVGIYLLFVSAFLVIRASDRLKELRAGDIAPNPEQERHYRYIQRAAFFIIGIVFIQLWVGLINMLLLAPVVLQLVHLLLADLVWIGLVLLAANVFAKQEPATDSA